MHLTRLVVSRSVRPIGYCNRSTCYAANSCRTPISCAELCNYCATRSQLIKSVVMFCVIHSGHLHGTFDAVLCLGCEACCGIVVQECKQRWEGQLQSDAYGKVLACEDDQGASRKNWSAFFCRKLGLQFSRNLCRPLAEKT